MFQDARQLESGARIETDLCIVGAGAAGVAIARELVGSEVDVCVLESGGLEPDVETQSLYEGVSAGRDYDLVGSRMRFFGGSTNHWEGACRPLDPIDFETRQAVPRSGWPLERAHLAPYYARAHRLLGLGPADYDGALWLDDEHHPWPLDGGFVPTIFQRNPVRMGQVYRQELADARNVRVLLRANAVEIALRRSGRGLEAIRCRCLGGPAFSVKAKRYVLACGGIENARLLLASNAIPPSGVGNGHGLVGRFFMEHPHVHEEAVLLASPALPDISFYRLHPSNGTNVRGFLQTTRQLLEREGILNFLVTPWRSHEKGWKRQLRRSALVVSLHRAIAETDAAAAPQRARPRLLAFSVRTEQAPNPQSRVTLDAERDALGVPRSRLDWQLQAIDLRTLRRSLELTAAAVGAAQLGRVRLSLEPGDTWPESMEFASHHIGTTRMHHDPARGVVDAHCRVHDVPDLFVAGSSVFPTAGASNPTLTIVALALRLADHLRAELR
jgi:choline dehydrogenase-like flavoprotein